jgi:hypothetical protein
VNSPTETEVLQMQNRRNKTVVIARLIWYSIAVGKFRNVVRDFDQQMFVDG